MGHGERQYWDMEIEPLLNTPKMREMQWTKLQRAIRYCYEKVPFDRNRMEKAGVKPEDIRSFDDFARAIPHVGQAEFRDVIMECGMDIDKVFLTLLGKERLDDLYLLTTTSGTTGVPTPYPVFKKSLDRQAEVFGRIGWRMGIRPGDRIGICFGLSMHAAGTPHLFWFKDFPGVTLIPIGAEAGTERILRFIKLFKVNVFTGTPSLALHLIERAPDVLGEPVKSLGIKILLCGAEPGAGIPEVRQRLESEYGAKLFDAGAGYGCSCDYPIYQGMHWIADDYCYYELVDPETKEPVPMEHGAAGLAVFTPLEPETAMFAFNLRFTLNDIHQVFTEPCPCGLSGFRYKIVGRADDMLKVKGVPIYPAAIEGVIHSFAPRLTGAFRIVLEEPPPRVVPPLKLKIEYGEGVKESELPMLEKELQEKMHKEIKIRPAITWLKPNTLERATKKTNVLEKLYEKK
ncbi:MAG: phenylacetate--CoA ligase family protein [Candidatus Abyssobacteria bacterium SURF_17]|uniref:Phenylacetate--CoA ligase family protein n=1 Tax=Candidatus Abyssobacteria bacterium SURF_17 TaxID=2093361 RepID=A0A419F7F9_9BACT|nr:MAG: phenylacetate--CoA ligase family protein [Candidatus Abyssubacteria bacterium SURF_17]